MEFMLSLTNMFIASFLWVVSIITIRLIEWKVNIKKASSFLYLYIVFFGISTISAIISYYLEIPFIILLPIVSGAFTIFIMMYDK